MTNLTTNIYSEFASILSCRCKKSLLGFTNDGFECEACGRLLSLDNFILIDSKLGNIVNSLENIDYDNLHGINLESSKHLGKRWIELIQGKLPKLKVFSIKYGHK